MQAQKVYTTDNIPKVHLQNKMRYVCNPDGILSQAACDSIDRMLYALEQQTGIETVVAVVPSIGNDDCFDFAHRLLNEWGVGKKGKNNGLVILLVTDQRCIQFYTGYGLEGDLPDAICKRIQTRDMIPYLKDGNWDAGMVAGMRAVCGRLDGSMVNDTDDEEDISFFGILAAVIGFFVVAGGIGKLGVSAAVIAGVLQVFLSIIRADEAITPVFVILLIADLGGAFNMIAQVLIWVSLVLTIVSLIDYIAKNVQVLTQGGM